MIDKKTVRPVYVAFISAEGELLKEYWIDYNDNLQRRVFAEQAGFAISARQTIVTSGVSHFKQRPEHINIS